MRAVSIVAHLGDHRHRIAKPRGCDCLIRSFAARLGFKASPDSVCPIAGMRGVRVTRSIVMLPTMTIGLRESVMKESQ